MRRATGNVEGAFANLATDLRAAANPAREPKMEAYMKERFMFLGITSPERKAIQKPFLAALRRADADDIVAAADLCWAEDAREFQYVGSDLLRARAKQLRAHDLAHLHRYITTKSWWDTIDALAAHPVGTLVQRFPALGSSMDTWVRDENIWVARTAILHQLRYKESVDQPRLFGYVLARANDTEFFIRKALGWALRSYSRHAPDAVRSFVSDHESALSALTCREALKHL